MRPSDFCELAADLAAEHGAAALDYARRAMLTLQAEGATERARFWEALTAFLDDIFAHRIDPDLPIVIH